MILKLGTRKIERIRFIARCARLLKNGRVSKPEDPDRVMAFCRRNGYVLVNSQPVHRVLFMQARADQAGEILSATVKDPWEIVKGLAVFTAERPLNSGV